MNWRKLWPFGQKASFEPPPPLPAKVDVQSVARGMPLFDRWPQHPGQGGISVSQIAGIYHLAEAGYPATQCELFDDMIQRDGHLRSQLENRVVAVAGKDWIIIPGGDNAEDRMAAEMLESALRMVPNWLETMIHLLQALWYGYSVSEIVWDASEGQAVPLWFSNVPHERIVFDDHDRPRLLTDEDLFHGIELQPGKWIYATGFPRRVAAASGVMRTAAWLSYFKKLSLRDWIVFSERFGLPYVQGKYEPGATPEDKATLKRAVQEIGKDGAAVFAKTCEIVLQMVDKGGKADDVQGALARFCDDEISELVTGSTLTSRSGGPGSFALGSVHADRSFGLSLWDAQRIGHRFAMDVGLPFVRFNRIAAKPPRLKIQVVRDTDPKVRVDVLQILWGMGVPISKDQLRQEFQLQEPRAGDALEPPATPADLPTPSRVEPSGPSIE